MLIIKSNSITIPRGISPSFTRTGDEKLQSKKISITKNGTTNVTPDSGYLALDHVQINTNVIPNLESIVKTYTENGKYTITKSANYDGIGQATITVDIPKEEIILQDKDITITKNGDYTITKDSSFDGMNKVTARVNIPEKKINLQNKTITENGSVTADSSYDGLGTVTVNVPIPEYKSQDKEVSYETNGSFTLKPDKNYDGISSVKISINVPIPEYQSEQKTVTYSANGDYSLKPSEGKDGISEAKITVNVPSKEPKLEEQTVDSSTLKSYVKGAQVFVTPHDGYDGLSKVTVNKLTFEGKEVITPTTKQQVISPSKGYDGFDALTIAAVDSTIDSNITPANIKKGVEILGVTGTNEPHVFPLAQVTKQEILSDEAAPNVLTYTASEHDIDGYSVVPIERIAQESITKTITENGTVTLSPSTGYNVIKEATLNVNVPSKEPKLQEKTISKDSLINNTTTDTVLGVAPDSSYDALSKVSLTKVNMLKTLNVDVKFPSDDKYSAIKFGAYDGVSVINYKTLRQDKTVDSSINSQVVTSDSGYVGLKSVTVNPPEYTLLKYIQSDGACAYVLDSSALIIDTFPRLDAGSYHPLYGDDIKCDIDFSLTSTNKTHLIHTYSNDDDKCMTIEINNGNNIYVYNKEDSSDSQYFYLDHELGIGNHKISIDLKKDGTSTLYTEQYYTDSVTVPNDTHSYSYNQLADVLLLFANYNYNNKDYDYDTSNVKIHSINITAYSPKSKIDVNYNFIPVIHNSQVGFLETNSGTFCKNLGTGTPKYELL